MFLEAHFGEVEYHMPDEDTETEQEELVCHDEPSFLIQLDDAEARINLLSMACFFLFISYFFSADVNLLRRSIAVVRYCEDVSRQSSRWRYQP